MKINSFGNVIQFPTGSVRGNRRSDGEGGSARQQYDPNQSRRDDQDQPGQESKDSPEKFDPKLIDDAMAAFQADAVTQEQGLTASIEGTGPGLRIHVKDCNGATLRQFSGEEFLRLREAASRPGLTLGAGVADGRRGKILDQKR